MLIDDRLLLLSCIGKGSKYLKDHGMQMLAQANEHLSPCLSFIHETWSRMAEDSHHQ